MSLHKVGVNGNEDFAKRALTKSYFFDRKVEQKRLKRKAEGGQVSIMLGDFPELRGKKLSF